MTAADEDGKATPRRGMRRALVETELLEQAARLFAERGYAGTSLQDVADAMGTSRPALYYYVRSKEELLSRLFEDVTLADTKQLRPLARSPGLMPEDKLRSMMEAIVTERATRPARFRLIDRSENDLPAGPGKAYRDAKRSSLREFVRVLDEGVADGSFRPMDTRVAALGLIGMGNWVAWWFHPDGEDEPGPSAQLLADMAVRSVASAPDRRGAGGIRGGVARLRHDLDELERMLGTQAL